MCFSWESIITQTSPTYLLCGFDNAARVLPYENGAVISLYLIKPLWADFSADRSEEKLNGILQMMLAYLILSSTPFVAKATVLKSIGNIVGLISHYIQTHVGNHGKEKNNGSEYFWWRSAYCYRKISQ